MGVAPNPAQPRPAPKPALTGRLITGGKKDPLRRGLE